MKVVPVAVVKEKWRQTAVMEGEGTSWKGDTRSPSLLQRKSDQASISLYHRIYPPIVFIYASITNPANVNDVGQLSRSLVTPTIPADTAPAAPPYCYCCHCHYCRQTPVCSRCCCPCPRLPLDSTSNLKMIV